MKRLLTLLFLITLGIALGYILFGSSASVYQSSNYIEYQVQSPQIEIEIPKPSQFETKIASLDWSSIKASSVYAFNPVNGQVFFSKNIKEKRPIASITKLATSLVAYNEYGLGYKIKVSTTYPKMDRALGLNIGDEIKVGEILKAGLIASKNDSFNALAYEYPAGYSSFINKMNEYASMIGMEDTHFSNPTGYIDSDNYSTAYDLGILSSVVSRNSVLTDITSSTYSTVKIYGANPRSIPLYTTNQALSTNKYIKGLKTGFTYASGECLILFYDFSPSDKLITIVLNSPNRFLESQQIYKMINKEFN